MVEVGKFYKMGKGGPTIFCTNEDLETFSGIVVKQGRKNIYPLGSYRNNFNADFCALKQVKPQCNKEFKQAIDLLNFKL